MSRERVNRLEDIADRLGLGEEQKAGVERRVLGATIEEVFERRIGEYREAVEEAWEDGKLSRAEVNRLGVLAKELDLEEEAGGIEREVLGVTREEMLTWQYREAVEPAWVQLRERLDLLAGELGLSREQAAGIEHRMLGETGLLEEIRSAQERDVEPSRPEGAGEVAARGTGRSGGEPEKAPTGPDVGPERQDRRKQKEVLGVVAATFAGVTWIVSGIIAIADAQPPILPLLYEPIWVIITALVGTLGGLIGLHTRQAPSYGKLGTTGFLLAFVGTTLCLIGVVIYLLLGLNGVLALSLLTGLVLSYVGFVLLGVAILRARVLPRWYGVAFIIAVLTVPVAVLLPLTLLEGPGGVLEIVFGVFGLVWLALGYVLWSQRGVSAGQPDV